MTAGRTGRAELSLDPSARAKRREGHKARDRSMFRESVEVYWRSSPALSVGVVGLTMAGALLPIGMAYAGKGIVDGVVAGSRGEVLRWTLLEFVIVALLGGAVRGLGLLKSVFGSRLAIDINKALFARAHSLPLCMFEDAEFQDRFGRAQREAASRPEQLLGESLRLVQEGLSLAAYGAILWRFSPWAILALVTCTFPSLAIESYLASRAFQLRNARMPERRLGFYLEHVLSSEMHAKEVKLLDASGFFTARYTRLAERFHAEDAGIAVRRGVLGQLLSLLGTGAVYGGYGAIALAAAAGRLSLGSMSLYLVGLRQTHQALQSGMAALGGVYEHQLYMSSLLAFLRPGVPTSGPAPLPAPPSQAASPGARGIVFKGVGFRYPGQTAWVLRDVSFMIPEGTSVALVGGNGAGKSTLIRLLVGLHAPTEGEIYLDGLPLRSYEESALRARFGVVFQDFSRYMLDAAENVGLGDLAHVADPTRLGRALGRSGGRELVDALPDGSRTQLGKLFERGVELSGGQWQKIALARAFMREGADIYVLDEPTSALDSEAESVVVHGLRELGKGKTSVVISHRIPTIRLADLILVLDGGRLIESGTHTELRAVGGWYAGLFERQARGYT